MRTTHSKLGCDSTRPFKSKSGETGSKAAHGRAEGMVEGVGILLDALELGQPPSLPNVSSAEEAHPTADNAEASPRQRAPRKTVACESACDNSLRSHRGKMRSERRVTMV